MKIVHLPSVPKQAATSPLFVGGAVSRQDILSPDMGKFVSVAVVHFSKGARNKFHSHSSDQILIVTEGKGIVATEKEERVVSVGDVAWIPAGEKHWHGATKDSAFSHIYVTAAGSKTETLE